MNKIKTLLSIFFGALCVAPLTPDQENELETLQGLTVSAA